MNERAPNRPAAGGIAARAMGGLAPAGQEPVYLAGLNPEQKEAVLTTEGPLLVLAGAGTGKTRVLTTRIAHILASRLAWPSQILAVTFTNKAAREMKARIGLVVGDAVEGMPWLGTFHSICVKILRRHAELVGLKSSFTILDTDDQIRLLKQLIQAEGIDDKRWPARQLAAMIDGWKNKALGPDAISEGEARGWGNGKGRELYRAYQERLKTLNACDFGDLLVECIRLFRENDDVLAEYHARFKYILVDEYQDTNVAQYLWLRLLAQPRRSGEAAQAAEEAAAANAAPPRSAAAQGGDSVSENQNPHEQAIQDTSQAAEEAAGPDGPPPRSESGNAADSVSDKQNQPEEATEANAAHPRSESGAAADSASENQNPHEQAIQDTSQAAEEAAGPDGPPPRSAAARGGNSASENQNRPEKTIGNTSQAAEEAAAANAAPPRSESGNAADSVSEKQTPTNICCVGDDDQSIYGWRGAEVDNILRFDKDFRDAKVIRLERNYRSTSHILAAASQLITHNEDRLGKTLFTDADDPDEEKIVVAAGWDSEEEARAIGEEIEALQTKGHALNDIAILVRASFQMREFEDRFVTLGLNYRVIGGPRFYERMEIRDAMAYFRVTCQGADDLAFERIVNTPKRGLGDATLKIVRDHARRRRIPMLAAVGEIVETEELKPKPRATLKTLYLNFQRWAGSIDTMPHTELAEMILEESGYTEFWQNDRSAEAPGRLENLKELVRSMEEFESMRGFLEHVSLVMDVDNNEALDAVNIMTLHSAKGLEFDTVFLPGWEEGLFPHQRSLDEGGRAGLEEERRLAYVGITRARHRARIWFVSNRRIHGQWQASIPSRFIDELPEAHVDIAEPSGSYGGYGAGGFGTYAASGGRGGYGQSRFDQATPFETSSYTSPGWRRAQANATQATRSNWGTRSGHATGGPGSATGGPRTIEGELIAKSVIGAEESTAVLGERVFHLKFGYGEVIGIDGNKLTVDFEKAGQKRVLDSFVERH